MNFPRKTEEILFTIWIITSLNLMYFVWKPYNKHLLSFTVFSMADFLSGLIYLALFFFVFLFILAAVCKVIIFITPKQMILMLGVVISIRVSVDWLKYLCGKFETHQMGFIQNLLEYAFLSAMFLLILKVVCGVQHQLASLGSLKLFWKEYLLLLFIFTSDFILSCRLQNKLNTMQSKYLFASDKSIKLLETIRANSFFIAEIKSMLLEIAFTCIALFIVSKMVHQIPTSVQSNRASWPRFFRQIALVLLGAFVLQGVRTLYSFKLYLVPGGSLAGASQYNNTTTHTANSGFIVDQAEFELARLKSLGNNRIAIYTVYTSLTPNLWYNNQFLISYISDLRPESYQQADLNNEIYLSGTQAFVYFTPDGTPVAYRCDDLDNMPENPHLTATLKRMVATGKWEYFICASGYLQKYASDFISPYINYYAKEDFSQEYAANPEINPQYIEDFALKLLAQ